MPKLGGGDIITGAVTINTYGNPALEAKFNEVRGKNLYNKALAENGKIYNNITGAVTNSANYAISGLIPVVEGNTYCFNVNGVKFHFWGATGLADHIWTTNSGVPAGTGFVTATLPNRTTFTIPVGSGVRFFSCNIMSSGHTTEQFAALIDTLQCELGLMPTSYIAYGTATRYELDSDAVTNELLPVVNDPASILGQIKVFYHASDFQYLMRMPFDTTSDLLVKVTSDVGSSTDSAVFDISGTWIIDNTVSDNYADLLFATLYAPSWSIGGDDNACPWRIDNTGTAIGANHGHSQIRAVTATGHGKALVDIGSEWEDEAGTPLHWYLVGVPSADILWMCAKPTSPNGFSVFLTTLTGNLTHVAGATNTGGITITASIETQLHPSIKNHIKSASLNGITAIPTETDGYYQCEFIEFEESYDITDMSSVIDSLVAKVGTNALPDYAHADIDCIATISNTYRITPNGAIPSYHSFRALKKCGLYQSGIVQQAGLVQTTGKNVYGYVPLTLPIGGTDDWTAVRSMVTFESSVSFPAAVWADADNPPYRMAEMFNVGEGDTGLKAGMMVGYSPIKGYTAPATRKLSQLDGMNFRSTTRKMYPIAIENGSTSFPSYMDAGTFLEAFCWRVIFRPQSVGSSTIATYVDDGKDVLVFLDYHTTVDYDKISLPAKYKGRTITVVDKTDNVTIHNTYVGADGVLVSVGAGTYGCATLRLS